MASSVLTTLLEQVETETDVESVESQISNRQLTVTVKGVNLFGRHGKWVNVAQRFDDWCILATTTDAFGAEDSSPAVPLDWDCGLLRPLMPSQKTHRFSEEEPGNAVLTLGGMVTPWQDVHLQLHAAYRPLPHLLDHAHNIDASPLASLRLRHYNRRHTETNGESAWVCHFVSVAGFIEFETQHNVSIIVSFLPFFTSCLPPSELPSGKFEQFRCSIKSPTDPNETICTAEFTLFLSWTQQSPSRSLAHEKLITV